MTVRPQADREEVAREFERYNLAMMPVVDEKERLIGIVTVDDVIDIITAETTEDVQRTVGAGAGEAVYSGVSVKFRGRFPWLVVNLGTSLMAAMIVLQFDHLISELAVLAVLMPVIANQAGNAGQQSLAVTLRGIVLDEVRAERVWPLLLREAAVGLINGTLGGTLIGLGLGLLGLIFPQMEGGWRLGVVAGVSMALALATGCFCGSTIPILMRRLKLDPAHGSTIFLTMITDSLSFFTFLGCAQLASDWLRG
jgi:magnesium transporter